MNPLNIIQFVEKKTGKSPEFKFLKEKVIFYNLSTLTLEECQEEMDRNNGHLNLFDFQSLTSLPDGLQVPGDLNLGYCESLTSLPDGLQVGEYLNLTACKSLTSLPDGLQVPRDLRLSYCESLTSLPDGLQVIEDLYLFGCKSLTKIGKGIKVGGTLRVSPSVSQLYNIPDEKLVSMFGLKNEKQIQRW